MGWMGAVYLLTRSVAAWGHEPSMRAVRELLVPHTNRMTWIGHCTFGPVDLALAELAFALKEFEEANEYLLRSERICNAIYAPAYLEEINRARLRFTM